MTDPEVPLEDGSRPSGSEDKVRKDLVQVFFGLVLTQIAVYVSSLVEIRRIDSLPYWAAWSHIILAFALTTTSWFGWQMSVRKARLNEEASVFQAGFVLSILDILLVTLYFLLVHQVELEGVAAFPPKEKPTLAVPSAGPETWIIIIVFGIYAMWDTARRCFKEVEYGPWPSLVCMILAFAALIPALSVAPSRVGAVVCTDAYLFGLVFLFRAFKRLQKHNFADNSANNCPGQTTFRFRTAPWNVKKWVIIFGVWSVTTFVGAAALIAYAWVCREK